jgi:restriction system protein
MKLIKRLMQLEEDIRYQESASENEPEYLYIQGSVPVLISAPHGAVHTRDGKLKEEDEYTGGLAQLIGQESGAHVLYTRRKSNTDPNYHKNVPYKRELLNTIRNHSIRFVLDVHGASADKPYGIELGTARGQSCPEHKDIIIHALERFGFNENNPDGISKLWVDRIFTGEGDNQIETVTRFVWKLAQIPAAQFEINAQLRIPKRKEDATQEDKSFTGDPEGIENIIKFFGSLVSTLSGAENMDKPKHVWVVRAGDENELADEVEGKSAIAIGWEDMGNLSDLTRREQFKERYREIYPDHSEPRVNVNSGQVYRFTCEIEEGDYLLTYVKSSREILIGLSSGGYEYNPVLFSEKYPHTRRADWIKRVSRDIFTSQARNSLGSSLTVFQVDNHLAEIHALATETKPMTPIGEEEEETPPFYEEVRATADELISDMISGLDPYDFQNLVAAVLEAMGYQALSSPPGRDRGVDIVAYPDALGFERPRIKVQVKHRKGKVSGPDMRAFVGVLRQGDNGLYVSTGDFTPDAEMESQSAHVRVTLLDRDRFIQLMLENYPNLDPEFQALIPLRRVWLPVE